MKSVLALGLGLLSLAHAAPCGGAADPSAVPSADGSRFKIDGKTGYYAGSNAYWIGFLKNNKDIDTTLDHVAASGLKILRVWGFNDVAGEPKTGEIWFQKHSSSGSVINTGADGLQRLDYVVKSAESRGVKLIINFVNYWDDYGGMNAYVSAYGGTKQSWFTNSKAQAQYKKYISTVVARYANSNALFSWQLANEPRCQGCSTDVIYKWATEISAYIKSLDSKHMISIGDEGFGLAGQSSYPYGFSEGVDFVKNLAIKDISFGTIHMYPDSWGVPSSFGPGWIKDHAAACKAAGKPCLLEEYGYNGQCDVQKTWQQAAIQVAGNGMGGDAFWQWGESNLSIGTTHNDGNTVFYGSSLATCLVTDHVNAIKAAGV